MSVAAMHWAWSQVLPPAPKLILMALADNADDAGYCWPRVKKIAERCSVSERTVQRTLKNFETSALLKSSAGSVPRTDVKRQMDTSWA